MVSEEDIGKLAAAARVLPPNMNVYLEEDFVMNLLETVLDYMLQTEVVVRALERFRESRWNELRTLDDRERVMARFPDDRSGSRKLNDQDVIELATRAAERVGIKAFELDWRIWEASRGGALPYPTAPA
jgi:hypothetical protein